MGAPDCGVCPGYLVALPLVGEALSLHLWWDKGQLSERLGDADPSPLLPFYVEQVAGAVAELQVEQERRRELERQR